MAIPKVFISYSHDSLEHKKWVLDVATRLRNTGVDAIIDQWELKAGDDLPLFMETHLKNSDYVLIVCTDKYVEKANSGVGGVGYEKMIITSDLIKDIDSNKFIPIIKQNGTHNVPIFLKTKLFIDFSNINNFEFSYDELVRTIHDSPLYTKPKIGNNPFTQIEAIAPKKSRDALKELMTIVIKDYENGKEYSIPKTIKNSLEISRIMFDVLVQEVVNKGLIIDGGGYFQLTHKGKSYAIENNLVKR